jgi:hypothetical protein
MRVARRTNLLWGLLALAIAILVLLNTLLILPGGLADLLARAWPALLVIGGLGIFLRDRVRFGSLIALLVGLLLTGALAAVSFSSRATQLRDDNQTPINQVIGPDITLLRVQVDTLATDVEIVRALAGGRAIGGLFSGSQESELLVVYTDNGDTTADLTVREARPNTFPLLSAVGRGQLRLELPADLPLDVGLQGDQGAFSLNLSGLALERLNIDAVEGDALVTLPDYDPRASGDETTLGTLIARRGNITIFVPADVAARLELNRGGSGIRPEFDPNIYNLLDIGGGVLEARNFDQAGIRLRYVVTAPQGQIGIALAGSP